MLKYDFVAYMKVLKCFSYEIPKIKTNLMLYLSVQVDESTVPWDFYISSQLRARLPADHQHGHAQSTCYLYENGSFTLWKVPQGQTIQVWLVHCLLK